MNKFYRGPYASYVLETHGQGIYFAIDKGIIIMNGKDYVGPFGESEFKSVKNIALNEAGDKFVITYVDKLGVTSSEEIVAAKSEYESAIEDKNLAMPNAVGGIAKGTKLSALEGKTYNAILDDLLFPTVNPTYTSPSASISFNGYATTQEVGAAGPTKDNFTTSFSAGAINLNGVKQANRAGSVISGSSFIYVNGSTANKDFPTTVPEGSTTFNYHAEYEAGPQPKDNKGNDYQSPLAAGSVNSQAVTLNGTYPWFASTSAASAENPVVKQSLVAWNTTAGAMSTGQFAVQPSGTLAQVFKLPRQLKTLQMLNTVSGAMDTIGTSDYTETTETLTINGIERTYYVYTYKGSTRGSVTLLAKF